MTQTQILIRTVKQKLTVTKRQKIVISASITTIGLMMTQVVSPFSRTKFIIGLLVTTFVVSLWALWEGMSRVKALTVLVLPLLFTLGVSTFYFLLPIRWLTRLPFDIVFGLSIYFLFLSQNVFNVASVRTIPLYRAASTVTFLFTVFTSILLFHVLHAFSLPFVLNGIAVFLISFLLILPILWSVDMEEINIRLLIYAFCMSLIIGEVGVVLSFWPIPSNSLMWSIVLSSVLFILLGFNFDYLRERLGKREVVLYILFGVLVLGVTALTTSWSG